MDDYTIEITDLAHKINRLDLTNIYNEPVCLLPAKEGCTNTISKDFTVITTRVEKND